MKRFVACNMKINGFIASIVLLLALLPGFTTAAKAAPLSDSGAVATGWFALARLPIESILNNPAVLKTQVSRNLIQAIGRRPGGEAHFIVHFRNEKLHGGWQSFYTTAQPCDSGRFEKGLPDGEWKTWHANGQLKTVRHYSAQKFHFILADIRRNHPKDKRFPITRYAGKNYATHFQPKFENQPAENHSLSMLQKIHRNTSGNGYLSPFRSCLHHGLYMDYFENGMVKDSGNYVNGLKHGLWKETAHTGSPYAFGFYFHGTRQGKWNYYTNDHSLFYTEFYNKSGKKREWHYFEK